LTLARNPESLGIKHSSPQEKMVGTKNWWFPSIRCHFRIATDLHVTALKHTNHSHT